MEWLKKKFRSELREIENEIIANKNSDIIFRGFDSADKFNEILEIKRRFILDRRESWLPKTIWNLLVPIIVSVATSLIVLKIGS